MTTGDYNPFSQDAMLAKILANQESHSAKLDQLVEGHGVLEKRVTTIERDKWYARGALAVVAFLAPGAWEWFKARNQ